MTHWYVKEWKQTYFANGFYRFWVLYVVWNDPSNSISTDTEEAVLHITIKEWSEQRDTINSWVKAIRTNFNNRTIGGC